MAQIHQVIDNQTVVTFDMEAFALCAPCGIVEPVEINQRSFVARAGSPIQIQIQPQRSTMDIS